MLLARKFCLRKLRKYKYRWLLIVLAVVILYSSQCLFGKSTNSKNRLVAKSTIDVVYTWVNGSDPEFVKAIKLYETNYDATRYDDKNELRYSLRSLEMYAPWINHIYIVTNGQIPYWLDLCNKRITIVPHEVLIPNRDWLPIFSSAAIETFLHRIPNLSERFLYLNDDIFLNAPLYPEDLYTESQGVKIYKAWMMPDCAEDCPWTYIGDGACDKHCNTNSCQYDGGDCLIDEITNNHSLVDISNTKKNDLNKVDKKKYKFGQRKHVRYKTSFKKLINEQKISTLASGWQEVVDNFNQELNNLSKYSIINNKGKSMYTAKPKINTLQDIYSRSLIYSNMLLNRNYGFKARHVIAHVGFLLERSILQAMQHKFHEEIVRTASHRLRATNDLQFAFVYYWFVMSETEKVSLREIFNEFDTDLSLTWSDREIRTLLTRMFPLPLEVSALHFLEQIINNCTVNLQTTYRTPYIQHTYTTLIYERYADSQLPTVTRDLVENCKPLAEALEDNFAIRPKYKFHINPKSSIQNNFVMLTSNASQVADALDRLRKTPRKFNCINDNMEADKEENVLVRQLLEDFYLSFFPHRSQFELPAEYRNRYETWHDYQRWMRRKRAALIVGYGFSIIVIIFLLRILCFNNKLLNLIKLL